MYDVLAVDHTTNKVRIIAANKTLANAEAIVAMAVARRGVGGEFFAEVHHGTFRDGDTYCGVV